MIIEDEDIQKIAKKHLKRKLNSNEVLFIRQYLLDNKADFILESIEYGQKYKFQRVQ